MSHFRKSLKATLKNIVHTSSQMKGYTLIDTLEWIEDVIPKDLQTADNGRSGFYFASADAGARTSIEFYREALEKNVSFANPRNFPATLSNFVAASFAQKMAIRGPNINIVGGEECIEQLLLHALVDLQKAAIEKAIVSFVPSFLSQGADVGVLWIVLSRDEHDLSVEFSMQTDTSNLTMVQRSLYTLLDEYPLKEGFVYPFKEARGSITFKA